VCPVFATTFVVNNISDTVDAIPGDGICSDAFGNCTLRAAVQTANEQSDADLITFSLVAPITIGLVGSALTITSSLTITPPPGLMNLTVLGGPEYRAFDIFPSGGVVTLNRITISGGYLSSGCGGGIMGGNMNLNHVVVRNNSAGLSGGGICGGGMNISDSTIADNRVEPGNGSAFGDGGGIFLYGSANITRSTISGNRSYRGPGIYAQSGVITITNSTIANNTALNMINGLGGGICALDNAAISLTNVTIANNTSFGTARISGIYNGTPNAIKLRNTIVAANNGNADLFGSFTSLGNNLIGNPGNVTGFINNVNGDKIGVNPVLAPLANNGGPTLTHALAAGSPAINAGNNCIVTLTCSTNNPPEPLTTDQRGPGFSRQVGPAVDMGAFEVNAPLPAKPFDFDGDLKTDLSIFRPPVGEWWINRSLNGTTFPLQFGAGTDRIVPGDFTGDGKTDIAFFRPSTGQWFVLRSEDFSFYAFPFGTSGDVPVPADYDADGKADAAVFRPSTLTWFIAKSTGGTDIIGFGSAGDVPTVADYDGDGKADIAIYRPNAVGGSQWWVRRSSTASVFALQFGTSTDRTVQGDYTGDGKADIAFWRPSTGGWFVLRSEDFSFYSFPFGANGDTPVPGDYDGDGRNDAAVFRPSTSTWFAQRSTAGTLIQQFGIAGDIPLPSAYVG
jgi:CSLREA domain-containing protein